MSVRTARQFAATSLAVALAASLSSCSSSSSTGSPADPVAASSSAATGDPHIANVTVTAAKGCTIDRTTFDAGALTFKITNQDATAVSEIEMLGGERIVGEKENLPPGFSGSFVVNVPAGSYSLYCPGASQEKTPLTVTGAAATAANSSSAALLAEGAKQYAGYVNTQVEYLVQTTTAMATALRGTDLVAAQNAYKKARPYYEKIEPVAESFTTGKSDLDASIDARAGDVPPATWTGFHRIEKGLFQDKSLTGLAPFGAGLVTNVKKLQTLTASLTYQPFELANGAQELLDEVSSSKITGEEERYSRIDLLDVQGNVEGAEQAFADLQPGLVAIDPALAASITAKFAGLKKLLDTYRNPSDSSGFVLYTTLTATDKRALAAAVKAVQEPLSRVASKVAH
jgi:iron uptake system component EfeO